MKRVYLYNGKPVCIGNSPALGIPPTPHADWVGMEKKTAHLKIETVYIVFRTDNQPLQRAFQGRQAHEVTPQHLLTGKVEGDAALTASRSARHAVDCER